MTVKLVAETDLTNKSTNRKSKLSLSLLFLFLCRDVQQPFEQKNDAVK